MIIAMMALLAVAWSPLAATPAFDLRPELLQRRLAWREELMWPRVAAGLVFSSVVLC